MKNHHSTKKALYLFALTLSLIMVGAYTIFSGMFNNKANNCAEAVTSHTAQESLAVNNSQMQKVEYNYRFGNTYLKKYESDKSIQQLVLVEQAAGGGSSATLFLLTKNKQGNWEEQFHCQAFIGKNGLGKTVEGDGKTPSGDYKFSSALGIKADPGSKLAYTQINENMYLCGDKEYYNQLIDTSKVDHICSVASEHLIKYVPQYNYVLNIDYNKEGIYGKGSAIFLHCFGSYDYTLGCIAISEANMVELMKSVDEDAHICIYAYQEV